VRRIIALSTTAVYRDGSHRGAAEQDLPTGPASATSATRLAAEGHVLRFGGTVLRPHLVYGAGDRWVIPTLVDIMRRVHVDPESIEAKLSMVCVEDLARAIAALALGTEPSPGQRIYHANHPEPVEARELVRTVERELGGIAAAGADGDRPDLARRRGQLTTDHYYASERLWRDTGVDPGPGFAERFARHAAWYRESLTAAARH
jgi:nucleoside-diphosphate-sugar epimerase